MAGQYTCGSRITWLQSPAGNSMTEQDACVKVANEDFSESCGPQCDPLRCERNHLPSTNPSGIPSRSPVRQLTTAPSRQPSKSPTLSLSCGCQECSDEVLNQMAGQYSCGSRITWLQSPAGNSMTEQDACVKVANEDFSESCGPQCDPLRCGSSHLPSTNPSGIPSRSPVRQLTTAPSRQPSKSPASSLSCGCQECSDEVLNQMAGQHSCGSRITWLQSPAGNSMTERDACVKVANEDFSESCGPQCDPLRCR
eukprot:scaffold603_cov186-Chaetoceros_neogracile.AAC.3